MKTKYKNTWLMSVLFLAPALIVYSIFVIQPMVSSFTYSLTDWNGVSEKIFIGFENYTDLFNDSDYWIVFSNTIKLVIVTLLIQIPLGLIIAYILYNKTKGMKFFRAVYFLPVVIAPVAIGLMFSLFYNSEFGIFNKLLEIIGLESLQRNWLSDINVLLYAVMLPQVWQYIGLYVTIYLAALQSIPEEIIESARIDGANRIRLFTRIIIPQMRRFTEICIILCVTGSLKSFDHSWIMTGGGPGVRSAYLGVYMYKTAFTRSDFGMGSAITVTIALLALIFTVLFQSFVNARHELD